MAYIVQYCMCTPCAHNSTGQVGNFLRKDNSCDRTLVIYIVLFIYVMSYPNRRRYKNVFVWLLLSLNRLFTINSKKSSSKYKNL